MGYVVVRPPLNKNFSLPTRDELLALKTGDLAKLIFQVEDETPERMWVIINDCSDDTEWTGTVDNDAIGESTSIRLPAGTKVKFHPLDIVATWDT